MTQRENLLKNPVVPVFGDYWSYHHAKKQKNLMRPFWEEFWADRQPDSHKARQTDGGETIGPPAENKGPKTAHGPFKNLQVTSQTNVL